MRTAVFRVINGRSGKRLGDRIVRAETLSSRLIGLLGHTALGEGEGLWIEPCSSIHMFFMSFAIDAVFLNRERRIVRTFRNLRPWTIALGGWFARSVLELPPGTIDASGTRDGDDLEIAPA
jgi:uncharacterized membrane protein (UPF0127 family)